MLSQAMRSGSYRYLLNGEPTQVLESWDIEGDLAAQCQISSRRAAPGLEIVVDAQLSGGKVQNFNVVWHAGPTETVCARYQLFEDELVVVWRGLGCDEDERTEISLDAATVQPILFPLMRIFTGPLINCLLEAGGEGNIVLPDISDPANKPRLLRPQFSVRRATVVDAESILYSHGEERPCRRCEYTGDQYTAGSYFWLGADGLLERYQWQQSADLHWDVWLERSN
ncbi:MAG: hypothetical protein V7709_04280 [Halioglobus sp.]